MRGKTANITALGPSLLFACERILDLSQAVNRQIIKALKCNLRLEAILEEHDDKFALPPGAAQDLKPIRSITSPS